MKKPRIVLHTKFTGEIFLSIFLNNTDKLAEIPMGTDQAQARKKAQNFLDAMRDADGFIDQTT